MIRDILTVNTVDINVDVKNWQDAVVYSGRLLEKAGFVEERYIEAMLKVVNELGPYIVLLKGVALAHARPEAGAKKVGLSLITLKNPVEFGHEKNDPVNIVFALSAIDSSSHVELISELGKVFYNESDLYSLSECGSKEEMINKIFELCSKSNEIWD